MTDTRTLVIPLAALPVRVLHQSCCRSAHVTDDDHHDELPADDPWMLTTIIPRQESPADFRSARAGFIPRLILEVNRPFQGYLPYSTPDGTTSTVSIAATAESGLTQTSPPGMTLSPDGLMQWTPTELGLHQVQFTVSTAGADGIARTSIPYSLAIQVVNPCATCRPAIAVAPAHSVSPGTTLNIPIQVMHTPSSSTGTRAALFKMLGPNGSVLSPVNGAPPLASTFSWTPGPDDAGLHHACFQAAGHSISGGNAPDTTLWMGWGLACITITVRSPSSVTFNSTSGPHTYGSPIALSASTAHDDDPFVPIEFEVVSGSGHIAGNQLIADAAGDVEVRANYPGSSTHEASSATHTFHVDAAPLTITANNAARQTGAANPAFTAQFSGFVNGDSADDLAGTLSFATSATASSPAGTYPITPSGLSSPNYAINFANGTLTVTDPASIGQMVGDGTVTNGSVTYMFTIRATENVSELEFALKTFLNGVELPDKFKSRSITSVTFGDGEIILPGESDPLPVGTLVVEGFGEWQQQLPGYRYRLLARDADVNGGESDFLEVTVWSPSDQIVLQFDGVLSEGRLRFKTLTQ